MVDLHCHILPGLDDGPATIDISLAMAEEAIADGITHVVATPHCSSDHQFDFARVRAARDELSGKIGHRLKLATGSDFHLNHENLQLLRRDDRAQYCLNQKDYLLVEFNEFSIPPSMNQTLHDIQLLGLHPVITHPERNGILRTQPDRLLQWVRVGCYVQVTAGSLSGVFGRRAQDDAWNWIGQGLIHFVSSDAHNTARRPLKLRFAYDAVAERFGPEKADALFLANPRAAFEGDPLPHVPDVAPSFVPPRRKRFIFF
jgi:protein-tyrosine phosphatase